VKQQPVDEFDAASQQAGNSTSSSNVTSMCRSREVDIHLREIAEHTHTHTHARTHTHSVVPQYARRNLRHCVQYTQYAAVPRGPSPRTAPRVLRTAGTADCGPAAQHCTHTPYCVRAINLRPNSRLPMFVMCTLAANQ